MIPPDSVSNAKTSQRSGRESRVEELKEEGPSTVRNLRSSRKGSRRQNSGSKAPLKSSGRSRRRLKITTLVESAEGSRGGEGSNIGNRSWSKCGHERRKSFR